MKARYARRPMGTWGTALYSDDLAADIRDDLNDLFGEGLSGSAALEKLEEEYASSLQDPDEATVFWLAVAHRAWKLGRPIERATAEALRVVESGADLARWEGEKDRRKRRTVLAQLAAELRSEPPPARRVARRILAANAWELGEVIAFRLLSGRYALLRVIGHHHCADGRFAICEPLDWVGTSWPAPERIAELPVRASIVPNWPVSQFMIGEPRRKADAERLVRTDIISQPAQAEGAWTAFGFPELDERLREIFGWE